MVRKRLPYFRIAILGQLSRALLMASHDSTGTGLTWFIDSGCNLHAIVKLWKLVAISYYASQLNEPSEATFGGLSYL